METERLVSWLRDKADRAGDLSWARMMKAAADRLEELEQERRWIPVTEQLPNKWFHPGDDEHCGEPFDFNVFIRGALIPTSLWFNGESFVDETGALYDVTHWRYLPEPPKEGIR